MFEMISMIIVSFILGCLTMWCYYNRDYLAYDYYYNETEEAEIVIIPEEEI